MYLLHMSSVQLLILDSNAKGNFRMEKHECYDIASLL